MEEKTIFIKSSETNIKLEKKNKRSCLKSIFAPKRLRIMINILFFLSLFFYFIFFKIQFSTKKIDKYAEFLPKITLSSENDFPSVSQVFNSRELFISDINLTLDYIKYISDQ